ncbi:hypothetical protein GTY67_03220 [Streptomyces sp. SID8374]|uniref:hypothetical protein n=1 Tax=Streptomyces sp. SID8374 TaxID=2690354 RepID=UPI00136D052A|nr:hypothetical protein [Streptomyces sp. SID8374]MYX12442.1 hypothetical protein [Streptomyces sp. SID8374]
MKASDFLISVQQDFLGTPWVRQVLDTDRVAALRSGPLGDVPDLEAAQAIVRFVCAELEAFGTGGGEHVDDEGSEELLRCLKAVLRRHSIDFNPPFRSHGGFRRYWIEKGMDGGGGYAKRRSYLAEIFDPIRARLDELEVASERLEGLRGVDGTLKNIVFASTGYKPEIIMSEMIDGAIEIVEHADTCLVYNRPLTDAGLTWGELVDWWREQNNMADADDRTVALSLHERLKRSLGSEAERYLFYAFVSRYAEPDAMSQPALLPQVYVHFDPLTERQRQFLKKPRRLARERMDFLLLLPGGVRIVIEVDGKHHYAREVPRGSDNWEVAADLYSEMVAEDRALRLKGYEVFRFGGKEILAARENLAFIRQFFLDLEARFWCR